MKSLQYSNDSQQSVKIGDTDTTIKLLFNKDNQVVDLTAASSINLKVADSQHAYIKTVSIDISNQSDLANGYLTIDLDEGLISGLPSGTYYFEIWVNIDNETEIYPDSGFKSFVIKNNIEQGSSSYTTITLNDISAKLTETANTLQANVEQSIKDEIANGDFKGEKGDPGNTGNGISSIVTTYANSASGTLAPSLTISDDNGVTTSNPVWQSTIPSFDTNNPFLWSNQHIIYTDDTSSDFQMVSNLSNATAQQALSQVQGMNLGYYLKTNILQASGNYQSATDLSSVGGISTNPVFSQTYNSTDKAIIITKIAATNAQHLGWIIPQGLLVSTTYTLSVKYKASITTGTGVGMQFGYNGNYVIQNVIYQTTTDWVTAKITFTTRPTNTNNSYGANGIWFSSTDFNVGDYIEVQWIKLEVGTVATDYSPSPSEILTTANYNKLVAAIVALGGSI